MRQAETQAEVAKYDLRGAKAQLAAAKQAKAESKARTEAAERRLHAAQAAKGRAGVAASSAAAAAERARAAVEEASLVRQGVLDAKATQVRARSSNGRAWEGMGAGGYPLGWDGGGGALLTHPVHSQLVSVASRLPWPPVLRLLPLLPRTPIRHACGPCAGCGQGSGQSAPVPDVCCPSLCAQVPEAPVPRLPQRGAPARVVPHPLAACCTDGSRCGRCRSQVGHLEGHRVGVGGGRHVPCSFPPVLPGPTMYTQNTLYRDRPPPPCPVHRCNPPVTHVYNQPLSWL
jgi:hypothetical protein